MVLGDYTDSVSVKNKDIEEGLERCNTEIDAAMNIFNVSKVTKIGIFIF
jgi:hypothetical protein